ncbi:hypothetical protein KY290_013873 [Solanum tuberosum]|uniref:Retrotransposon Copia-like N-terminal domain-containing protein n=1 Tax=Solanum tuberosum TaxID=4113 RepID=A0ABQ7VQR2_SOLTU|nr:hypothetical protein KY289_013984 [Solanum tuberosum]KAH0769892.1 hypothetical protein KY290_013873 [Solanum tuberosum]
MNLISTLFDGRGFLGWRRSILIALSAKRKLGFINGTCQAPASDASDSSQWNCCNDMVTSWLLNSLSKEIGDSVIYSNTAKELWDSLKQRFGKSSGTKLFHLQKELNGLVQGMDLAYSLLLQDENQREIYQHTQTTPGSSSFMAINHGNHNHNSGFPNLINGNDLTLIHKEPKGRKASTTQMLPTYCFRTGHVMDDCHRLHGYPEDFEFTKGKNSMIKRTATFAGEDNSYQSCKEGGTTNFQHFTKEQMAENTQMVKEMQMSQSMPSTEINANGVAGTILKYSGTLFSVFNSATWIIDS